MALPLPARISIGAGLLGLLLAVLNQGLGNDDLQQLLRANGLASLLAVGLMLVGILWTRASPGTPERAVIDNPKGLVLVPELSASVAAELGWGSQMLLTATPAASVLVHWRGRTLLRRGLLATDDFRAGPTCERARQRGRAIHLVDLKLYPGRGEWSSLPAAIPSVVVQPLAQEGWLLVGGWSARCFSRSDETWIAGWAARLTERLLHEETPGSEVPEPEHEPQTGPAPPA
ncbi:MAG: cofactor assembly of complex C subunit B [Cyanobacteriota bacterium]